MKIKYNRFEILFHWVLITIMVFSFTLAIRDAIGILIGINLILGYIMFILLPMIATQIFPKKVWIAILLILAGVGLYIYQRGILSSVTSYFLNFAKSIWKYLSYQSYFDIKYANLFIFIIALILVVTFSFLVFLGQKKTKVFLIFSGTISMAYFWFIYIEKAKLYLMYFLFSSILCYSYQVFKEKEIHWKSMNSLNNSKMGLSWVANAGIIILFALIISFAFPMNIKPIRWNWVDHIFIDIFPFIVEWRNDALDSYSYGYSSRYNSKSLGYNDKTLGGPVELNKSVMFELKTNGMGKPFYLKGIVKDVYTGSSWEESEKKVKKYLTTGIATNEYPSDIKVRTIEMDITPKGIMTSTIFYPYILNNADYKGNKYFVDEDGEAYFSKLVRLRDSYKITVLQPLVNVQKLKIDTSLTNNKYILLPEVISQRVKSLSVRLTENKNNDFEKVKAIQTYLRDNYKYILTPSKVPLNKEFADYFLFENKEGYCTYFATSMAVLLRASGIPCRYVEGFIANEDSWNGREYLIRGTSSHAWVEVKFEDFGWLIVEATPTYEALEYEISKEFAGKIEMIQDEKPLKDNQTSIIQTTRNKEILREYDEETSEKIHLVKERSYKLYSIILFIIIFSIWIGMLIHRYLKFTRLDITAKRLVKILVFYGLVGISIKPNETIRQFFNRAKAYDENLVILDKNISLLEKSIYAGSTLNERETKELETNIKYARALTIKKIGWIKYRISWLFYANQYCKYIF